MSGEAELAGVWDLLSVGVAEGLVTVLDAFSDEAGLAELVAAGLLSLVVVNERLGVLVLVGVWLAQAVSKLTASRARETGLIMVGSS